MTSFTTEQASNVLAALDLSDEDLAKVATDALRKRGFAVKIFGREDVLHRVKRGAAKPEHYEDIVDHVMKGDDWITMEEENYLEDSNIYALIEGTHGDHHEWFAPEAP